MVMLTSGATVNIGGEVVSHLVETKLPLGALASDRSSVAHLAKQCVDYLTMYLL